MRRATLISAVTIAAVTALLTACGTDTDTTVGSSNVASSQAPQVTSAAPIAQSDAVVGRFTTALDQLGIKHGEPKREEVGLSGAKMRFDITVDGFDAGINIFPTADALAKWQEASDSLGGIHVTLPDEYAVLTLNSSEGIADSARIAPMIAKAVGGTARGV